VRQPACSLRLRLQMQHQVLQQGWGRRLALSSSQELVSNLLDFQSLKVKDAMCKTDLNPGDDECCGHVADPHLLHEC
jgi:hypothetical protein